MPLDPARKSSAARFGVDLRETTVGGEYAGIRVVVTHHPFDLPPGVDEGRLLGRARMAMVKLAEGQSIDLTTGLA